MEELYLKTLTLKDIAKALGIKLPDDVSQKVITYVSTNPMYLFENTLLFYMKRCQSINNLENYKGTVIITNESTELNPNIVENCVVIEVKNVHDAYWRFVQFYRSLFDIPVIGVTGTVGKTTVKEMIKHILSERYNLQSTLLSNNGTFLNLRYLMGIDDKTEAAVFEIGVLNPGNITNSCRYFYPTTGIITNIGVYHLQGCGTLENYIKAKEEILPGIKKDGILIINGDDSNIKKINMNSFQGQIIRVGYNEFADYCLSNIQYTLEGMTATLKAEGKEYALAIKGFGQHNLFNATLAIAAVHSVGISIEQAIESLKKWKPMDHHLTIREGVKNSIVIDDVWNCTPPSVHVALDVLSDMYSYKKKIVIMGKMKNLGASGLEELDKIGKRIVKEKIDYLVVIGDQPQLIVKAALKSGMDETKVRLCDSVKEAIDDVIELIDENTAVLVKTTLILGFHSSEEKAEITRLFKK